MKKIMGLALAALLSLSLTACGTNQNNSNTGNGNQAASPSTAPQKSDSKMVGTPTPAVEGTKVSEEHPLAVDKATKTVRVYAKVNGKYLVEPTRHGLNFKEGKYGAQALFMSYANQISFYNAMMELGGKPGNNLNGNTKGQAIQGQDVNVTVTWDGAPKEYTMTEVVNDSTGKPIKYKFGGNLEHSLTAFTGCLACFDSCPVGITSNSSHAQGEFAAKKVEFTGKKDVLPKDGTPVVVTFKLL